MKKFTNMAIALGAFAALAVGGAKATPITFHFDAANLPGAGGLSLIGVPSLTFTDAGSGLNVVATAAVGNVSATKPVATRPTNSGGLGVIYAPNDSPIVDGTGNLDVLKLAFSSAVKIRSAIFTELTPTGGAPFKPDKVDFKIDGVGAGTLVLTSHNFVFSGQPGTFFDFGVLTKYDNFKLASISVSPVPVPPAMLLFASGLFGIGLLGRRRNKSI